MGFLNPNEVLTQLKLKKGMTAADFGSGSGGWALPLAKTLNEGRVYAIDVLDEPLSALRARASLEKIFNIETIKSDVGKTSRLMPESCDLILTTNLLFQVRTTPDVSSSTSGVKRVLEEGKKALKRGGRILVIDWKIDSPLGPKEGRVSAEEVKKIAEELNLKMEKEFDAGLYHWGLIMVK